MVAFSRTADRNIVDHVNLDMNEDQGMTTFIMRVRRGRGSTAIGSETYV